MSRRALAVVGLLSVCIGIRAAEPERAAPQTSPTSKSPSLVVLIVVDQLSGTTFSRMTDRFGEEGFRRLQRSGMVYENAHFEFAATVTSAGHATLVTGRHPSSHGIVGNRWFDRRRQENVDCVEGDEPDTVSRERIRGSTIGDDLVRSGKGRNRAFAVSLKRHSSLLLAGREGQALWYEMHRGVFVAGPDAPSGEPTMPGWLQSWNHPATARRKPRPHAYLRHVWRTSFPEETYAAYCAADDDSCVDYRDWITEDYVGTDCEESTSFAYALGCMADLYPTIRFFPVADEMTLELTKQLVRRERIGQGPGTDLLAVGFSATDLIGHLFGPDSLEYEDNLIRFDRTLARLLSFLDRTVGTGRYAVVLTSDHGTDSVPGYRKARGEDAGIVHTDELLRLMNERLREEFEVEVDLVREFLPTGVYLDRAAIARGGLKRAEVEAFVARRLPHVRGIRRAFTAAELGRDQSDEDAIRRSVRLSFDAERSGDVLVVTDRYWNLGTLGERRAYHGTPYDYDTHVPILFAGPGIPAGKISRRVAPCQIADTIAAYLGIEGREPASEHPLLSEVLAGVSEASGPTAESSGR